MVKFLSIFILFFLVSSILLGQQDKEFFTNAKEDYNNFLVKTYGNNIFCHKVVVKGNKIGIILMSYVQDENEAKYIWNSLYSINGSENSDNLSLAFLMTAAAIFEKKIEQIQIEFISSSYNPKFKYLILYDKGLKFKTHNTLLERNVKVHVNNFEAGHCYRIGENEVSNSTAISWISDFLKEKYKGENCKQEPYLYSEYQYTSDTYWFDLENACSEVVKSDEFKILGLTRDLRPVERISLIFTINYSNDVMSIDVLILGKYGSGLFRNSSLSKFRSMEPEYINDLAIYSNKILTDLHQHLINSNKQ